MLRVLARFSIILALVGLSAVACNSQEHRSNVSDAKAIPVIQIGVKWASGLASDITLLNNSSDEIVIGKVTKFEGQRIDDGGTLAIGPLQTESMPISLYELVIESPINGLLNEGDTVTVEQRGGVSKRSDGTTVRFVLDGDEPLRVGTSYLFWLARSTAQNDHYSTVPFARMMKTLDGSFVASKHWAEMSALKELSGLGQSQLQAAVRRGAAG